MSLFVLFLFLFSFRSVTGFESSSNVNCTLDEDNKISCTVRLFGKSKILKTFANDDPHNNIFSENVRGKCLSNVFLVIGKKNLTLLWTIIQEGYHDFETMNVLITKWIRKTNRIKILEYKFFELPSSQNLVFSILMI